jgi:hypothetical protein
MYLQQRRIGSRVGRAVAIVMAVLVAALWRCVTPTESTMESVTVKGHLKGIAVNGPQVRVCIYSPGNIDDGKVVMRGPVSPDGSFYLAGELPSVRRFRLPFTAPRRRSFETFGVGVLVEGNEVCFRVFENCLGHRMSVNYDIRLPDISVTTGGKASE